jgi:hypothetical protein
MISGLSAQAPGYMGKKCWIEGDFGTMVAFRGPNLNNKGAAKPLLYGSQETSLGFNSRIGASLNFTVGRKVALSAFYQYAVTGMIFSYRSKSPVTLPPYYNETDNFVYNWDIHGLFYQLKSQIYGIKLIWYPGRKGSIAPLGFYMSFAPSLAYSKVEEKDHFVDYGSPLLESYQPMYYPGLSTVYDYSGTKIKTYLFKYSIGKRFILFDRVTLNTELETTLGFGKSSDQDSFSEQMRFRLKRSNSIYFTVGLGYLIF